MFCKFLESSDFLPFLFLVWTIPANAYNGKWTVLMEFIPSESARVRLTSLLASLSEQPRSFTFPLTFSWSLLINFYVVTEMWYFLHTGVGQNKFTVTSPWNRVSTLVVVCVRSFCFGGFVAVYMHVFPEALLLALEIREFPFSKRPTFSSGYIPGWSLAHALFASAPCLSCSSGLLSSSCSSCLCWRCQSSLGGRLSSPPAPVPISRPETLPMQPLCWWMLCRVTSLLARRWPRGMWCLDTICWNCLVAKAAMRGVSHSAVQRWNRFIRGWTGRPVIPLCTRSTHCGAWHLVHIHKGLLNSQQFGVILIFCCYHKI